MLFLALAFFFLQFFKYKENKCTLEKKKIVQNVFFLPHVLEFVERHCFLIFKKKNKKLLICETKQKNPIFKLLQNKHILECPLKLQQFFEFPPILHKN